MSSSPTPLPHLADVTESAWMEATEYGLPIQALCGEQTEHFIPLALLKGRPDLRRACAGCASALRRASH